jgi:Protein of unknown function (DUF2591)
MKIKICESTNIQLDWMVANIEDVECLYWAGEERKKQTFAEWKENGIGYSPSTSWAQGGPIIEREKITPQFMEGGYWRAWIEVSHKVSYGPTPLIAAMRCYVASKMGDEVEIPEEGK